MLFVHLAYVDNVTKDEPSDEDVAAYDKLDIAEELQIEVWLTHCEI